jgi:hypothetical protein
MQLAAVFIVFTVLLIIEILDWQGRAEIIEKKFPWVWRVMNARPARIVLMFVIIAFLAKDFRDATAVAPPPQIVIKPPIPPPVNITRINPPIKEQCWVRNYAVPSIPSNALTTMVCNSTYKPPFAIMIEYDQDLSGAEPITFPIGGFSKFLESPKANNLMIIVDTLQFCQTSHSRLSFMAQHRNRHWLRRLRSKRMASFDILAPKLPVLPLAFCTQDLMTQLASRQYRGKDKGFAVIKTPFELIKIGILSYHAQYASP